MINKNDEHILKKFGNHVRILRENKGLSLRKMSYACNIDNSKISKIEKGKVNITMITFLNLAAALEVEPTELLGFSKNKNK